MTTPAKYVHACRQAKKNGPGDLSPKILTEAVETQHSTKRSDMSHPTPETLRARKYASELIGFRVLDADEEGVLYTREVARLHGVDIEEWHSEEHGFHTSINADGNRSGVLQAQQIREIAEALHQHAAHLDQRARLLAS